MKRRLLKLLAALCCVGIVGAAYGTCFVEVYPSYCTIGNATTHVVTFSCSSAGTVTYSVSFVGTAVMDNIAYNAASSVSDPGQYYGATSAAECAAPNGPKWYIENCYHETATLYHSLTYQAVTGPPDACSQ
jgi:hypothetical protein